MVSHDNWLIPYLKLSTVIPVLLPLIVVFERWYYIYVVLIAALEELLSALLAFLRAIFVTLEELVPPILGSFTQLGLP